MNLKLECPRCQAPLEVIEKEDQLAVVGGYGCGALEMAFRDPRKRASIRLCRRLSRERAMKMAEQKPGLF